jgi:hypothetical protein
MNSATTVARPPSLKNLEGRVRKAQAARHAAWEKVKKTQEAHAAALGCFGDCLGHETAAFQTLCAARQGRPPDPAPPAPETLTGADEED